MKKILAVAACVMICGALLVNGTLAADLNQTASGIFADLTDFFQQFTDILGFATEGGTRVDVQIVSLDPENTPNQLYPGAAVQTISAVKNNGSDSVYFRLVCAVQYEEESWDKLDIAFEFKEEAYGVYPAGWQEMEVSGTPYRMKTFTYPHALSAGAQSPPVTLRIAMSDDMTSEQLSRYRSDFVQMQALAISENEFKRGDEQITAEDALSKALPLGTNPF